MSRHVFRLPDLGEGTVSSEIVAWRVGVGDVVTEDQPLVEMSTDKAVVEVPAPVSGRVVALAGEPGDIIAVGAELIVFETDAEQPPERPAPAMQTDAAHSRTLRATEPAEVAGAGEAGGAATRVMASPATRRRARAAGVELTALRGTGPGGRILRQDLDAWLAGAGTAEPVAPRSSARKAAAAPPAAPELEAEPAASPRTVRADEARAAVQEIKVVGPRRVIAQRMSEAKRSIPHFAYVEEVDVTELEALRAHLNAGAFADEPLSYLPFIVAALTGVLARFPQCNAHYDAERSVIARHEAVHVGIATHTPDGLVVPVVRHAERLELRALAREVRRLSAAARERRARREELTGSTITVTSLGKLGGIVSTPIINPPEVAIIGVNRAVERPVVHGGAVAVRRMMNLSSSFDHRFVDGHDAAAMIQALKDRLEHPATIFLRDSGAPEETQAAAPERHT